MRLSDEEALAVLGERLAQHRLNVNLTHAQLAHEAGLARRAISQIENGGSVSSGNLVRLLRALGLPLAVRRQLLWPVDATCV